MSDSPGICEAEDDPWSSPLPRTTRSSSSISDMHMATEDPPAHTYFFAALMPILANMDTKQPSPNLPKNGTSQPPIRIPGLRSSREGGGARCGLFCEMKALRDQHIARTRIKLSAKLTVKPPPPSPTDPDTSSGATDPLAAPVAPVAAAVAAKVKPKAQPEQFASVWEPKSAAKSPPPIHFPIHFGMEESFECMTEDIPPNAEILKLLSAGVRDKSFFKELFDGLWFAFKGEVVKRWNLEFENISPRDEDKEARALEAALEKLFRSVLRLFLKDEMKIEEWPTGGAGGVTTGRGGRRSFCGESSHGRTRWLSPFSAGWKTNVHQYLHHPAGWVGYWWTSIFVPKKLFIRIFGVPQVSSSLLTAWVGRGPTQKIFSGKRHASIWFRRAQAVWSLISKICGTNEIFFHAGRTRLPQCG